MLELDEREIYLVAKALITTIRAERTKPFEHQSVNDREDMVVLLERFMPGYPSIFGEDLGLP